MAGCRPIAEFQLQPGSLARARAGSAKAAYREPVCRVGTARLRRLRGGRSAESTSDVTGERVIDGDSP